LDLKHPMMYSLGNKKLHLLVEFRHVNKFTILEPEETLKKGE
jgi:hypothetical protein